MKILLAEDDPLSLRVLLAMLAPLRAETLVATDGQAAWELVEAHDPSLLLLDWAMPGLTGIELCRRIRQRHSARRPYIVLVTGRGATADVVSAFAAGADDFITKPYDSEQMRARIRAAMRIIYRDQHLVRETEFLQAALTHIRDLPELLSICACCKRIRVDDDGAWEPIERYVTEHVGLRFSHGICPACSGTMEPVTSGGGSGRG